MRKLNFEDMQTALFGEPTILISTLDATQQACLLVGTAPVTEEVALLNLYLQKKPAAVRVIIYGQNAADLSAPAKYEQLLALGFTNIYLYAGGLFEWLLLQDVYGREHFPTTSKAADILQYKGKSQLQMRRLM